MFLPFSMIFVLLFSDPVHAQFENSIVSDSLYAAPAIEVITDFLDTYDSVCNDPNANTSTIIPFFFDPSLSDSTLSIKQLEASISERQTFILFKPNLKQNNLTRSTIFQILGNSSDQTLRIEAEVTREWNYALTSNISSGSVDTYIFTLHRGIVTPG